MKAPIGALVSIFCDIAEPLGQGDVLRTRTGRCYVVQESRTQERGKHAGRRQHLRCLVTDEPPPGARVIGFRWYARTKARGL